MILVDENIFLTLRDKRKIHITEIQIQDGLEECPINNYCAHTQHIAKYTYEHSHSTITCIQKRRGIRTYKKKEK